MAFELNSLTEEQLIIVGHLTYHAGKLWNQANYLIQNRLAKPYYKDIYHKIKDKSINLRSLRIERTVLSPLKGLLNADVNGTRNILRKFKKDGFLKKVEKIKLYKLKRSSESLLYARIGVAVRVNLPRGIRTVRSCQTPRGASSVRAE